MDFEEQRTFLEGEHKASSVSAIQNITAANSIEVEKLNKQIQDLESALMLEKTKTEGKNEEFHFVVVGNYLSEANLVTLIVSWNSFVLFIFIITITCINLFFTFLRF